MTRPSMVAALLLASALSTQRSSTSPAQQGGAAVDAPPAALSPTVHPPVPGTLEAMWYAPPAQTPPAEGAVADLARGVRLLEESGNPATALPLVSAPALARLDVSDYASYYRAVALQRLGRRDEADAALGTALAGGRRGPLEESVLMLQAELSEARSDIARAAGLYERILSLNPASPARVLLKLGSITLAAGSTATAASALRRVLDDYPLALEASEAERLLEGRGLLVLDTPEAVRAELSRAERLYQARRWDPARTAFARVRDRLDGEDRDRVALRLIQLQAAQGQHRAARDAFKALAAHPSLAPEAQYGIVAATHALGEKDAFIQGTREFVARHPAHPLAEQGLNELARRFILDDEDAQAADVFTEMVSRFPSGALAERAAWRAGWWAFRTKDYRKSIRLYDDGAARFPRSDYRPSWLYWSGRAHDEVGDRATATARYRLAATDYGNSYYGRMAWQRLVERREATVPPALRRVAVSPVSPPPNVEAITRLIALDLYAPALGELRYAQRVHGDSAHLQATVALVENRLGRLRPAINAMKRAYPQYIAAGGETLPVEILRIIFPVDHWPLLKGQAQARGLDPYLVAALVAQESTFDAGIRSSANAIGLMQILPSTGRRYARRLGIQRFSAGRLTSPEINARIGTQYLADLLQRFGGVHYALASYNAGENRVQRWLTEAPGLPQDEWIDNIPFPETQNYLKRVLGTAEDYRRLYGSEGGDAEPTQARPRPPSPVKAPATGSPSKKAPSKKAPTKKAPTKKVPPNRAR
ncbi:MAG: transglycosylase SLT domain-containing protein [Acidobacteriota bacterium]